MFGRNENDKERLDAAVRDAALPTTALVFFEELGDSYPAVSTRVGGRPYAEAGEEWPVHADNGHPYEFIYQVDLRVCPDRPPIPADLIAVYVCWEAMHEGDVERAGLVRAYRDPSAEKSVAIERPPARGQDDYKVIPYTLAYERCLSYPWRTEEDAALREAAAAFRHPEKAYAASLKRIGNRERNPWFARVGGHPTWAHDNTLTHDGVLQFVAQLEPIVTHGHSAPVFVAASRDEPLTFEIDCSQVS